MYFRKYGSDRNLIREPNDPNGQLVLKPVKKVLKSERMYDIIRAKLPFFPYFRIYGSDRNFGRILNDPNGQLVLMPVKKGKTITKKKKQKKINRMSKCGNTFGNSQIVVNLK